jgi:hypothetical protein
MGESMNRLVLKVLDSFDVKGRGTVLHLDIGPDDALLIGDELKEVNGDRTVQIRGLEMMQKLISYPDPKILGVLVSGGFEIKSGDLVEHLPSQLPKLMKDVIDAYRDLMTADCIGVASITEAASDLVNRRLARYRRHEKKGT